MTSERKGRCGMNHGILSFHYISKDLTSPWKNGFQSGITGCMGTWVYVHGYNAQNWKLTFNYRIELLLRKRVFIKFERVVGSLVVTLMYSDCGVACYTLLAIIFKLCCVHL